MQTTATFSSNIIIIIIFKQNIKFIFFSLSLFFF